ncbi:Metallo-dependent phosphatase-like protein, partial [Obelidium mucronatum]
TTTTTAAPTYTPLTGPSLDFLVIGDWGTDVAGQYAVAAAMDTWAGASGSSAIISLGDNFYQHTAAYDGIQSANDTKFTTFWKSVYTGNNIKNLPWWTVLGNHDWYTVNSMAYEIEFQDANWFLPDFFYTKRLLVDTGVYASFIFIETDLFEYGYGGANSAMATNFASLGWVTGSNTIEKQLAWIENAIAAANNDAYIFVVGHHPTYTCTSDVAKSTPLQSLLAIVNKWSVSAYMNGHSHSQAGYVTNGGKTLQIQAGSGGQNTGTCAPFD